ncbi:hypothetical protein Tco_0821766, partial [Tanacetum coccineum]
MQIEGYVYALKSLIKQHNQQNLGDPICLDYDNETINEEEDRRGTGRTVKPLEERWIPPMDILVTELMTYPPLRLGGLPFEAQMGSSPKYTIQPLNSFEWRKIIFGMITSTEIRYAKPYTLPGGPSTKLGQISYSQTHVFHLYWDLPAKIEIVMTKAP